MEKFNQAKKYYNVSLWDAEVLLKLGIIKNSGITELNRKYRKKKKE